MFYSFNGVKIYFEYHNGYSNKPIIFLHGWGRSGEDFVDIIKLFPEKVFLTIDFPPFGKSQNSIEGWDIFTYSSMLISLFEHLNIENADFIGHSFGGRILMILAAVKSTLVHSCIFIDSAGLKPRRSLKYRFSLFFYKLRKKLGFKNLNSGSADYKVLSPQMKETFKSIVNTYLEDYAKIIKAKTLIIWGENDEQTPIYMAYRLKKLIKESYLVCLENAGHFSFATRPLAVAKEIDKFYKELK